MSENQYKKGILIVEGKTKKIYRLLDEPNLCIIESKNTIIANDDPSLTIEFETKAIATNITTCNVFQLLKKSGIQVAFKEILSETEFLSDDCEMIPLEVVVRRYAVGSFLKREPHFQVDDSLDPYRFKDLCIEFFLKTTKGKCLYNCNELINGLLVDNPYILNPDDKIWHLVNPNVEHATKGSFICDFDPSKILDSTVSIKNMETIAKKVFEILEENFAIQSFILLDIKIEFGMKSDYELVVADVIDNDSWRLVTKDWEDLSKQSFKDGQELSIVEKKYLHVMEITNHF